MAERPGVFDQSSDEGVQASQCVCSAVFVARSCGMPSLGRRSQFNSSGACGCPPYDPLADQSAGRKAVFLCHAPLTHPFLSNHGQHYCHL